MIDLKSFARNRIGVFLTLAAAFFVRQGEAVPGLTPPVRQSDGSIILTITGTSGESAILQGSVDMRAWNDLQTYTLDGSVTFRRDFSDQDRYQYFRLKGAGGLPPGPNPLVDLSTLVNAVFPAGEGFDTVQFAPNGTLGMLFWNGRNLTLRERSTSGLWREEILTGSGNLFQINITRQDYKFQPAALLLYDSNSEAHIFHAAGGKTIVHYVRGSGTWVERERIDATAANAAVDLLVGAIGPNDTFHLGVVSGGESPNLTCGSNRNGQWFWNQISTIGAFPRHYLAPSYAPRWLSLAVDSNNSAHIAFRPSYQISYNGGYVRAYNELAYASNRSGQWTVQIVQRPRDDSGEAGNGNSIAIGPDNKPYIASWHNERGPGGSAEESRLYFHSQDANGNWTRQDVISRPDGYIAGDNEKGTGFAPYLRFDAQGRPHILFLDHGSEHFGESGQSEYAGHIRHAVRQSGGQWQVESIYRQTDPKREQMLYPAFAMNGSELVVSGLRRATDWNMSVYPPVVDSSYRFTTVTVPLR